MVGGGGGLFSFSCKHHDQYHYPLYLTGGCSPDEGHVTPCKTYIQTYTIPRGRGFFIRIGGWRLFFFFSGKCHDQYHHTPSQEAAHQTKGLVTPCKTHTDTYTIRPYKDGFGILDLGLQFLGERHYFL